MGGAWQWGGVNDREADSFHNDYQQHTEATEQEPQVG